MSEQCGDCRGASSVVLSQLITDLKLLQRGFDMLLKECEKVKVDVEEADVNGKKIDRNKEYIHPFCRILCTDKTIGCGLSHIKLCKKLTNENKEDQYKVSEN